MSQNSKAKEKAIQTSFEILFYSLNLLWTPQEPDSF